MKDEIRRVKQRGVNGLVFGILDVNTRIDVSRTRELVELARPLSVTFHRAFDACADLPEALQDVVRTGADRVLTSGGAPTAEGGSSMLAKLVTLAAGRISVLACGRIRDENVRQIIDFTGVREVHTSLLARSLEGEGVNHAQGGGQEAAVLRPEAVASLLAAAKQRGDV
jgi:copper homeostasis protein